MTALSLAAYVLLAAASGAAVCGLIGMGLRFEERVLLTVVCGVMLPTVATFGLAVVWGLSVTTVLLGPVVIVLLVLLCTRLGAEPPWRTWRESASEARARWTAHPRVGFMLFAAVTVVFFGAIFARALTTNEGGDLVAGYQTVWADWSQHLTTESSFAVAGNVPPTNPLFSGTPLLYPFMPDFHSAELMVLGAGPGAALAVPGAVLAVTIALLLVCFAERVGARPAAGAIAAVVAVLGGGLGFLRAFGDACVNSTTGLTPVSDSGVDAAYSVSAASASGCDLHQIAAHASLWPGILRSLPTIINNQPRSYDGLLTDYTQTGMHNVQWPTPLMGWWLPQRSFLYGCAVVLAVALLIVIAARHQRSNVYAWGVAGVLAGLLPLIHVHSLIALGFVLPVVALVWRRREWVVVAAVTAVVAAPRMLQLLGGPHGSVADANRYPYVVAGWRYQFDPAQPQQGLVMPDSATPSDIVHFAGNVLTLPFQADWWEFWITNLGLALPLSVFVAAAVAARYIPGEVGARARTLLRPFPNALLPWAVGCLAIFAMANVVVFQTWDWDNTKLFAYWYMGAGLLIGCLVTHIAVDQRANAVLSAHFLRPGARFATWGPALWRATWRGVAAGLVLLTVIGTGLLTVARLLPTENPASAKMVGPFTLESASEIAVAQQVAKLPDPRAVYITSERPGDVLLTLGGRTTVLGFYGWLWSYGTVFGTRGDDVKAILAGCGTAQLHDDSCAVPGLLHKYGVSYVEVDTRGDTNGVNTTETQGEWWARQSLPVVARGTNLVVYDVRSQ